MHDCRYCLNWVARSSNPDMPHLAPANWQANVSAADTGWPVDILWMKPALNVSPAPSVSLSWGGG